MQNSRVSSHYRAYTAYRIQLRLLFCHKESHVIKFFDFWVYSSPSLYTKLIHSSISLLHQMRFMKFFNSFLRQSIRLLSTSCIIIWKFSLARWIVPRQWWSSSARFSFCYFPKQEIDVEKLQQSDYSNLKLDLIFPWSNHCHMKDYKFIQYKCMQSYISLSDIFINYYFQLLPKQNLEGTRKIVYTLI